MFCDRSADARNPLLLTVLSIALLLASPVSAQDIPKMGFYAGLGLDLAVESFDDFPKGTDFETGLGFILTVGYRFHPNIAFEGSCEYIERLDSDDPDPDIEASILAFNANFKGYLTTQRFQPFLLIGAGVTRVRFEEAGEKDDDVGITGHFGGGADYYLTPQISLGITATYVATSGKIEDRNHSTIGLGAQYRF